LSATVNEHSICTPDLHRSPELVDRSALPCPAGRSVPGRGGPERRRRPRPDGTVRRCRAAFAACQRRRWLPRNRPHPPVKVGANGATPYLVALASRATSVPFTTVTTGHERTATDNTTAASICALTSSPGSDPGRSGFGSRGSPMSPRPSIRPQLRDTGANGGIKSRLMLCFLTCQRRKRRQVGCSATRISTTHAFQLSMSLKG
jgi:hypothetical protein